MLKKDLEQSVISVIMSTPKGKPNAGELRTKIMSKQTKPTMSHAVDKAHLNELLVEYWEREAQTFEDLLRDAVKNSSIQMFEPTLCERIEDYLDQY